MYLCTLLTASMPPCDRPAVIEIEDAEGGRGWGCVLHAYLAMHDIDGARVIRDLRTEPREDER